MQGEMLFCAYFARCDESFRNLMKCSPAGGGGREPHGTQAQAQGWILVTRPLRFWGEGADTQWGLPRPCVPTSLQCSSSLGAPGATSRSGATGTRDSGSARMPKKSRLFRKWFWKIFTYKIPQSKDS